MYWTICANYCSAGSGRTGLLMRRCCMMGDHSDAWRPIKRNKNKARITKYKLQRTRRLSTKATAVQRQTEETRIYRAPSRDSVCITLRLVGYTEKSPPVNITQALASFGEIISMPISSKKYPCSISSPLSSLKKQELSSSPVSIT